MTMEHQWRDLYRGKQKCRDKKMYSYTSSTINHIYLARDRKECLLIDRQTTDKTNLNIRPF
jgi:hypothetical protein